MKKSIVVVVSIVGIVVLLLILAKEGENKVSPFWLQLDTILICNGIADGYDSLTILESLKKQNIYKINALQENFDYLTAKYNSLHKDSLDIASMKEFVGKPLLWNIKKIVLIFDTLAKTKKFIVNGVTGTGKSTFVDLTAKLLAGSPERVLRLQCVENMEVEYHKRWIGYYEKDKFIPGKLLKYLEIAKRNSDDYYVFILDDLDKIPPATFFGSEVWSELNDESEKTFIEGYAEEVYFPNNFFLISVTHTSADSKVSFSDEEKRRLGYFYDLKPNYEEFLLYLKEKNIKDKLGLPSSHIKKLIFAFVKINELINDDTNYGPGFVLGQWSTLRKKIKPEEFGDFVDVFIQHINSFNPNRKFLHSDLSDILKMVESDGRMPKTSDLYLLYRSLLDTGIFAELTVAVVFALVSGLFGWFLFFKKRFLINKIQRRLFKISEDYTSGKTDFDETLKQMLQIKSDIFQLVGKRQIKHDEAIFLLLYIDDQIDKIEKFHEVNQVTANLQIKFKEFMTDGVLDAREHELLHKFLDSVKNSIKPDVYYRLSAEIDSLYKKSTESKSI